MTIWDKLDAGYYYAPLAREPRPVKPKTKVWLRKVNDVYPEESRAYAAAMAEYESAMQRWTAAATERTRKQTELDAEFQRDVLSQLGLSDHPKADLLFTMAYQRGHSDGHRAVYSEAEDLAELLRP
jgi:hypothetical protein